MLRRKRAEVYADVREHLRYLDQNPDAPDRAERIATMVASPEPLVRLLGQRIGKPGADHGPMLEVLSRRYFGDRGAIDGRCVEVSGQTFFTMEYARDDQQFSLIATATDFAQLPATLERIAGLAEAHAVADVYVAWPDQPEPDAMAETLREAVDSSGLLDRL